MTIDYTLTSLLERRALDPRTTALPAFSQGERSISFGELHRKAGRRADALHLSGVKRGDRVAVLMGNCLEWAEVLFAIARLGAVCVPVNVLLDGSDLRVLLGRAGVSTLVVDDPARVSALSPGSVACKVLLVGDEPGELPSTGAAARKEVNVRSTDPAMIYFTSGTTGSPKGIVHSHDGILWNTLHQVADLDLRPDEVYLVVPSFSWAAGWHHITLAHLWHGGRTEILPTGPRTLQRVVDVVEKGVVHRAFLAPTLLKELVGRPDLLERLRASSLTRIMTGAEPLPTPVLLALTQELPSCVVTQAYGMTEMPLIAAAVMPREARSAPTHTGRASSITTLAVRRDGGDISPTGEGEIVLRSPATKVTFTEPSDADERVLQDGWFRTGDWGHIDADGYVTVSGRTKDVIITGGINIGPGEIEAVISALPGVAEVAVVGAVDERWGEVPVAMIVERVPGTLREQSVLDHCARHLSRFKQPRRVVITQAPLPKTATGKVLKRELRTQINKETTYVHEPMSEQKAEHRDV